MKKLFTLLAIAMFFVPINSNAQCVGDRYKLEIFSAFNLSSDIQYGNNINYAGFAEDLMLDVYEPDGDTLSNGDSVTTDRYDFLPMEAVLLADPKRVQM